MTQLDIQTKEEIFNPHGLNPELKTMENILNLYELFREILPHNGEINYTKKKIIINPAFNMVETLAHEALHHYFLLDQKTDASERYIKKSARKLIQDKEVSDLMEKYIEKSKLIPTRGLFGMIGG